MVVCLRFTDLAPRMFSGRACARASAWLPSRPVSVVSRTSWYAAMAGSGIWSGSWWFMQWLCVQAARGQPGRGIARTLAAGNAGSRSITVKWTASLNATGYTVQRCQMNTALTACGAWANAGTVAANITTLTSTGLTTGRSYRFQVRANGAAGNSVYSAPSNTVVAP